MRKRISIISLAALCLATLQVNTAKAADLKEWSYFIFLNGHNNLDSYGSKNIIDMEKVGSTDQVNIVVQWASMAASTTKRLYIKKSNNPKKVMSPTVNNPGLVDMGDYHSLVDFVTWAAKNYPAKHYFVSVWDHGGGWHQAFINNNGARIKPYDISWDDRSGHFITTQQLGEAMTDISKILGQKVDVYGSDACLMAMAEVASEMNTSVNYFVGSEETEPGDGWPYQPFLAKWTANPTMSSADVSKLLSSEYVKAYSDGGVYSNSDVTMSAMDLTKLDAFNSSIKDLGQKLKGLIASKKAAVLKAADSSQSFEYADYKDFVDFTNNLESANLLRGDSAIANARSAAAALVIESDATDKYRNAHGLSIWLPSNSSDYSEYQAKYGSLNFNQVTGWGDVVKALNN